MKLAATLTPEEAQKMVTALKLPIKDVTEADLKMAFTYPHPLVGDINIDLEAQIVPGGS